MWFISSMDFFQKQKYEHTTFLFCESFTLSLCFINGSEIPCSGGVMVSVLASSAVDHGFEPRSGQTKDYKIGICCFSAKHAALTRIVRFVRLYLVLSISHCDITKTNPELHDLPSKSTIA
jgi:hypothetical protein